MINNKIPPKARNAGMAIASEQLKQMFDEMTAAGFTERQALDYMSGLMARLTFMGRNKKDMRRDK